MRLREHKRIEKRRREARPGFRYNTDLGRWEFCHGYRQDIVWRPCTGTIMSLSASDIALFVVSYDETWAEETV